MHARPPLPSVAEAPESLLASGHLWLREFVDGAPFRFSMADSGLLAFASGDRAVPADDPPLSLAPAVRAVRSSFDRDAFRDVVVDPAAVTFVGLAPRRQSVAYDWARTPPFLGTDVYDAGRDRFLPVDAADRVYDRLGLSAVNALAKELPVRDFHPDRYAFPVSAWYDGPVAGVVVRNRNGTRGLLRNPAAGTAPEAPAEDVPAAVESLAPPERVRATADAVGPDADLSRVADRLAGSLAREAHADLQHVPGYDPATVRSALAEHVRQVLSGW
jgi:uncharacterized membrane protein